MNRIKKKRYDKNIEKNIVENEAVTDLPGTVLASENACPEYCCLKNEMRWNVRQAIGKLPEHHRQIVWLHFFYGYSYQEIAKILHLSKATIGKYMKRALRFIEAYLTKDKATS